MQQWWTQRGILITSLRLGPCWFDSMLLWMLNKWTSSGHSRCSFCSSLRKQLDRSPNNDTCPGSWISFGRKDRESWSGCHTHVHPGGNKYSYIFLEHFGVVVSLGGGLKDHLGSEVVHIEAKLLDSELLRPKCLARCLLFSVGTRLKQH